MERASGGMTFMEKYPNGISPGMSGFDSAGELLADVLKDARELTVQMVIPPNEQPRKPEPGSTIIFPDGLVYGRQAEGNSNEYHIVGIMPWGIVSLVLPIEKRVPDT